jgi:hypothetical protein
MTISQLALPFARFTKLALYLALLVLPGGFLGLLFLWWLDRRGGRAASRPIAFGYCPIPVRRLAQFRLSAARLERS